MCLLLTRRSSVVSFLRDLCAVSVDSRLWRLKRLLFSSAVFLDPSLLASEGLKCSPASPCAQRLFINADHPWCNRTQPWTDFICVRLCCTLPFLHYLGSRFGRVAMMRRCAQMPSPFFIPSTAERLCCLTAPAAERSAYLTHMDRSVIRPGSDLLHRRCTGSLSASSKRQENKGA